MSHTLKCPECHEPVRRGRIRREGWALKVPAARLRHVHLDGEPLCPVVGKDIDGRSSYVPALPIRA